MNESCNTVPPHFWLNALPTADKLCKNSIYFIKNGDNVTMYVTSSVPIAYPLGGGSSSGVTIISPNNTITVNQNGQDFTLSVSATLVAAINASIKVGDNISLLDNDAGYITSADIPEHDDLEGIQGLGTIHLSQEEYEDVLEINNKIPFSGNESISPITGRLLANSLFVGKTVNDFAQIGDISGSISLLGLQEVTDINAITSNKVFLNGGAEVPTAILPNEAVPLNQLDARLSTKADLVGGVIPASQLPSSIDDVLDGTYINSTTFNNPSNIPYVPMSNAIYVDTTTNRTYRWSGTAYVALGNQLALGITSSTAFRGDFGNTAYLHSQIINANPHLTTWQQVTDAGNTTTNNLGINAASSASASLSLTESSTMGGFYSLRCVIGGVDYLQVNNAVGVRSNQFGALGINTLQIIGNGTTRLYSSNQNSALLLIGNTANQTTVGTGDKTFTSFQDNVTAFTGTGAKNWNIISFVNIINLANQSGAGVVRGMYFAPTVSNIASNQSVRFLESTIGGAYFNTSSPQNSAILQADSTTQGFLSPRMTEAQRLAIPSPANGLIVYQTNNMEGLYIYKSTGWDKLVVLNQIVNGNTLSSAGTLSINPAEQNSYYTFQGTTSTWTLGTLANTANKFISLINMGSGTITLNTNTGGNDLWDSGASLNTMMILPGTSVRLYNNSEKFIINP